MHDLKQQLFEDVAVFQVAGPYPFAFQIGLPQPANDLSHFSHRIISGGTLIFIDKIWIDSQRLAYIDLTLVF